MKCVDAYFLCSLLDPGGHVIAMGVFGYVGYWAYKWDVRAAVLLAQKREEIRERRAQRTVGSDE